LPSLVAAASEAFVEHGFERTQMDDIAARLRVAKGTIYRSVSSKEALFAAVLVYADAPASLPATGVLEPIEWPEVSARLRDDLSAAVAGLGLTKAAAAPERGQRVSVGDEIEGLALDLFTMLHARRVAVMVLDRCAVEIPTITGDWYGLGRYALVDLWTRYLAKRHQHVTTMVEHEMLARSIVELITFWAVKISFDPAPRPYALDPGRACAALTRALITGGNP
jgi:AcrR family transcriptional regulator